MAAAGCVLEGSPLGAWRAWVAPQIIAGRGLKLFRFDQG